MINGESLSRAMARFPKAFDAVSVNLIEAAEAGGTLEETLQDIVHSTKKEVEFSTSLKTAMIYPAFVMVMFGGILIMLLVFVIPRISKVFSNQHVPIPWATRQLMNFSTFFIENWPFIIAAGIVLCIIFVALARRYRRALARIVLNMPGLRRLGLNIDLARFTRSLALLMKAGVPLDETLILAKRVVQKKQLLAAIDQMQRNIGAGKPLAMGMRDTGGAIPTMMARSMETAEISGTLEHTMQGLAEHFDTQVSNTLKGISSLLEPLMVVVVGLVVGILVITVIAPIYTMVSKFRPPSS